MQLAEAWQRTAAGDLEAARARFASALADALQREQRQDAWWILHHQALALQDGEAAGRAARLAADMDQRNRPNAPRRTLEG